MDESDFPRHEAGLTLEHNPHKTDRRTVGQYLDYLDWDDGDWVSPEQRQKAIETDVLWVLTWYPDTPVGNCTLAAADLDVLLAAAKEAE